MLRIWEWKVLPGSAAALHIHNTSLRTGDSQLEFSRCAVTLVTFGISKVRI